MILVVSTVLLVGCGGGGEKSPTSKGTLVIPTTIKQVAKEKKIKITKENAAELMETSQFYFPEFDSLDYYALLEKKLDEGIECEKSGTASIKTEPAKKDILFIFKECENDNQEKMNGVMHIAFDKLDDNGKSGYFIVENLKYTENGKSFLLNGESKFKEDRNLNRDTEYYLETKNLQNNETFSYNYKTHATENDVTVEGVFRFPDNTYFTLRSKNMSTNSFLPLIGGSDAFYDDLLRSGGDRSIDYGQIILEGENSELIYQLVENTSIYRLREDLNSIDAYYSNDTKSWERNTNSIKSNQEEAQLFLAMDKEEHNKSHQGSYPDNSYHNEGTKRDWKQAVHASSSIHMDIIDDDIYGEYVIEIKVIDAPKGSRISKKLSKYLLDYNFAYSDYEFNSRTMHLHLAHNVVFDKAGIYKFSVVLHDGDKVIERPLFVEYHLGTILKSEKKINIEDLEVSRKTRIETEENDNKILFNANYNRIYTVDKRFHAIWSKDKETNKFLSQTIDIYLNNAWFFDANSFITSRAEIIAIDENITKDLKSKGYLEALEVSHESNDLIYFSKNTKINKYLFITRQFQTEYYEENSFEDGGYAEGGHPIETLKIYSQGMSLLFEEMIRNYYIDNNGQRYKTSLVEALFIDDDKISILYKAKKITTEHGTDFVSNENSFYIEDIKSIK
jgi:hypothetical protein